MNKIFFNSHTYRKSIDSESLWHQRLCHPGLEVLKHVQSDSVKNDVKGPKISHCRDYALNEYTQKVSCRPTEQAQTPFEKIHFDLISNSPTGFDGSRYVLNFTDDLMSMKNVYLLLNKTEKTLFKHLKDFVAFV